MKYRYPKMFAPNSLPNQDGLEFLGLTKDGFIKKLKVKRCPVTGMHHVSGDAKYSDLVGWNPARSQK
jgi:hypothetical protein